MTSSLREGTLWLIKPGQRMLLCSSQQTVHVRETRTRKPTSKSHVLSWWREGSAKYFRYMEGVDRCGSVAGTRYQYIDSESVCLQSAVRFKALAATPAGRVLKCMDPAYVLPGLLTKLSGGRSTHVSSVVLFPGMVEGGGGGGGS